MNSNIKNQSQTFFKHNQLITASNNAINIFTQIQTSWGVSSQLKNRAVTAFACLDIRYRQVFNEVFREKVRFKKFCTVPSSVNGHHDFNHGNLQHTVEVAEHAIDLVKKSPNVDANLVLLAAFLHDAAKAEEYYFFDKAESWCMTRQGKLIGHKMVIVQWLSVALATVPHQLSPATVEGLMHLMTSVQNVPAWTGIRQPKMQEAFILSTADNLSVKSDLFDQTRTKEIGYGSFHAHLKCRPYHTTTTRLVNPPKLTVVAKQSSQPKPSSIKLSYKRNANGRIVF